MKCVSGRVTAAADPVLHVSQAAGVGGFVRIVLHERVMGREEVFENDAFALRRRRHEAVQSLLLRFRSPKAE